MSTLRYVDRHLALAVARVCNRAGQQLDELGVDVELQFRAARTEVRGFSYERSLGQLRRFHRLTQRRL